MYGSFYKDFVRILARALPHVFRILCILQLTLGSYKSRKLDQKPLIYVRLSLLKYNLLVAIVLIVNETPNNNNATQ